MPFRNLLLREPDSFDQTLLWAQDMASLADATLRHFESLGARNAKLVWHTALSEPNDWKSVPATDLSDDDVILIRQARQDGSYAERIGNEILHVAILLTGHQHLWACLCVELDTTAADPRQGQEWQKSLSKLALRSQSVLQTERLRVDVDRLARAERLQRSLFAISDLANSDKETQEVMHDLHQIVGRLMYAENFFIVRYDRSDETMRFIYFVDTHDAMPPDPEEKIYTKDHPREAPDRVPERLPDQGDGPERRWFRARDGQRGAPVRPGLRRCSGGVAPEQRRQVPGRDAEPHRHQPRAAR